MPTIDDGTDGPTAARPRLERKLVVAALITDSSGRVLLSHRLPEQPMGGMWELAGGKVEPGEPPPVALAREVEEELGCACIVGSVYEVVHHLYPRFELVMLVYRVELRGTPTTRAVAALAWVPPAELPRYEVLPADVALLARIAQRGSVERRAPSRRASFQSLTHAPGTGGLDTHYLHDRLREELDRAARYSRPLSIILVDVDDLGPINDRHGRAVGDQVLAQLVALMTKNARAIDRVGHTSGAGFAILLPETSAGAALGIAERMRADVAARRFEVRGSAEGVRREVRCTISCGVASLRGGRAAEADPLLGRADAALWRAKLTGRNRTVLASGDAEADRSA